LIQEEKRTNIQTTPTSFHVLEYENINQKVGETNKIFKCRDQKCKEIYTTPISLHAFLQRLDHFKLWMLDTVGKQTQMIKPSQKSERKKA